VTLIIFQASDILYNVVDSIYKSRNGIGEVYHGEMESKRLPEMPR
jgi:hypothetical protein